MLLSTSLLLSVLAAAPPPASRPAEPHDPLVTGELPQYIFFSKSPTEPAPAWNQGHPESFTRESIEDIPKTLGTRGNSHLRVGVVFNFSILEGDPRTLARSVQSLLDLSRSADVPVLIALDAQNWWESRSDLWNWWDPKQPGYDPSNRFNVEWTGWGPQNAIKISWRDWGRQIRIRPAQNIMSPRVQAETRKRLGVVLPVIVNWYRSLPADHRYLFGGVKVGWETSINVNAYYYPDGNKLYEQMPADGSKDPAARDVRKGWTFGLPTLGYAAATSAGIRKSGELTRADIEEIVRRYLAGLCKQVRTAGLPAHMIFTHEGGTYEPWDKHISFAPAINNDSIPGWSFYTHDPQDSGSLTRDLESAGRTQWAAVEWWRGAPDTAGWKQHFERTLRFKHCRLIAVYNWDDFRKAAGGPAGVRSLVETYVPEEFSPRRN